MDELNKRIIEIMDRFNLSKSGMANALGVSLPLITHITSGRNKPGIELLQKVLTTFGEVDPYWLILGEGTMMKQTKKVNDYTDVFAKIESINLLINNGLKVNETTLQYHKLLLDEVLHLKEMSMQIESATKDLNKLKLELESIKESLKGSSLN